MNRNGSGILLEQITLCLKCGTFWPTHSLSMQCLLLLLFWYFRRQVMESKILKFLLICALLLIFYLTFSNLVQV